MTDPPVGEALDPVAPSGSALRLALVGALLLLVVGLVADRLAALHDRAAPLDDAGVTQLHAALREGGAPPRARASGRGAVHLVCGAQRVLSRPLAFVAGAPVVLADLMAALRARPATEGCFLMIDLEAGRGRLPPIAALFAFSVIPGEDGVGADLPDGSVRLDPEELLAEDLYTAWRLGPDLTLGLDAPAVLRHLARRATASGLPTVGLARHLYRYRLIRYVAPWPAGVPRRLQRLDPAPPKAPDDPLDPAVLRAAARSGADYLVRHLGPDGRFDYLYDLLRDQPFPNETAYSYPRHAGATLFLARAGEALGSPEMLDAASRALGRMEEAHPGACDRADRRCVGAPGEIQVDLGSAALALLAVDAYGTASADDRWRAFGDGLAGFLLSMHRPDGEFAHIYDPVSGRQDPDIHLPYYTGEAALALALHLPRAAPEQRPRIREVVSAALDATLAASRATLLGHFVWGEEHWTCQAADAAWAWLDPDLRARALEYCLGYADFIRRAQFRPGEGILVEQPDFLGAYGVTPLVPPHTTPVGARAEALLAVRAMARRSGRGAEARAIDEDLRLALRFLLAHQVRPEHAWLAGSPTVAAGGFPLSDAARFLRIDTVQHAGCAFLGAAAIDATGSDGGRGAAGPSPH